MKTLEWKTMDKSGWGDGPWQNEPDKRQWMDEATGLPCLIVRNNSGSLCGYVGVSAGHPCFQQDYDAAYAVADFDAHGGLTFADHCMAHPEGEGHGICHVVEPEDNDDVWWLGFDCAHSGDYSPAHARYGKLYAPNIHERYRDFSYVESEVRRLAEQLARAADGGRE